MDLHCIQKKRKRSNAFHCENSEEDLNELLRNNFAEENPYSKKNGFAAFKKK